MRPTARRHVFRTHVYGTAGGYWQYSFRANHLTRTFSPALIGSTLEIRQSAVYSGGGQISQGGKNHSVRTGLLLGFVAFAGLVVLTAAVAVFFTQVVTTDLGRVAKRSLPAIATLSEVAQHTGRMTELTLDAALAAELDPDEALDRISRGFIEFEEATPAIESLVKNYLAVSLCSSRGERAEKIERDVQRFIEAARSAFIAAGDLTTPSPIDEMQTVKERAAELAQSVKLAVAAEVHTQQATEMAASQRTLFVAIVSGAIVAAALVLALVLLHWIQRTLNERIFTFSKAVDQVRIGRQPKLDESQEEAFRPLANSLSSMAESINKERSTNVERQQKLSDELKRHIESEECMRYEAMHDSLTGLANRSALIDRLGECLQRAKNDHSYHVALLFIDLDRFKIINDSLGHRVGDEVLAEAARRIRQTVMESDSLVRKTAQMTARLGGDEFAILMEGITNPDRAVLVAERLRDSVLRPFSIGGYELHLGVSIGVATHHPRHERPSDLLQDADTAMYRAKTAGGSGLAVFDERMHKKARQRLEIENDLRTAVEEQEFRLNYEPIVCLQTGRILAFEALVRWHHPTRGIVAPGDFISVAEETGLILPIGTFVLREAAKQLAAWHRALPDRNDLGVSVNVSPRQLAHPDFLPLLEETLAQTELQPHHLRLEITESTILDHSSPATGVLEQIHEMGVPLHLDDFGTGYSSLSSLHSFPISVLKIDRSFVQNLNWDRNYAAVINAVMSLAQHLDIGVTAEGLEEPHQIALVQSLNCDFGQGYHFARAMPPSDAWQMLESGRTFRQAG